MKLKRPGDPREFDVEIISRDGATLRVRVGEKEISAQLFSNPAGGGTLTIDGRRYPKAVSGVLTKVCGTRHIGTLPREFRVNA